MIKVVHVTLILRTLHRSQSFKDDGRKLIFRSLLLNDLIVGMEIQRAILEQDISNFLKLYDSKTVIKLGKNLETEVKQNREYDKTLEPQTNLSFTCHINVNK